MTTAILKPYERRRDPGRFQRLLMGGALLFMAAFYGLMCSILPMEMLVVPLVPILIGVALILWMLPDIGGVQEAWMRASMQWFVLLNVLWPTYVAINAPGLPWISGTRLALTALMSVAVLNFATSSEFRQRITESMSAIPLIEKAFWIFWGTTALALLVSVDPVFSLNKFANNQLYWTVMLALSAWLSTSRGFAHGIGRMLAWTIMVVGAIAINEFRVSHVIWLPYLPGWLIPDASVMEILTRHNGRLGTGEYRVRGTFAGALYFAEYLAITLPFAIHMLFRADRIWKFCLVALGVMATLMAMFWTGSRSAALAMVLSPLLYGFMVSWRVRQQQPDSLAATAVLFAYPAMAAFVVSLVIFWRRLHVMIIGGGQHQASTDARATQWSAGWPKIISHPLGHGGGKSGDVLGFYNPGSDSPTVDSYFLTLLLDYGFIGLASFLVLMFAAIWYGYRAYNRARDEDSLMLAPITIALFNFTIIKAVSSTEGSLSIVFILIGCVIGLTARQQRAGLVAAPTRQRRAQEDVALA